MAKRTPVKVGDIVRVDLPVSAVWDDGRITVEISGTAFTQRVTISGDSEAIVEIRKAKASVVN